MPLPASQSSNQAEVQRNFRSLNSRAKALEGRIFFGEGVPTFTPTGTAIFIRDDGGAGSTLYVWEGASWTAK